MATRIDFSADFLSGDQIEYRRRPQDAWHPGWIVKVEPTILWIRLSGHSFYKRITPFRGEVRKMDHRTQVAIHGKPLPSLRLVRTGPAVLRAQPKPPPSWRSSAYLDFVRRQVCCAPGCTTPAAPIEAHHAGRHGVGQKAPDSTAVPLCHFCHGIVTDTYAVPGLNRAETELLFAKVAVCLLSDWLARTKEKAPGRRLRQGGGAA